MQAVDAKFDKDSTTLGGYGSSLLTECPYCVPQDPGVWVA